ncbi:hypothetical protein BUI56_09290 [Lactococcus lactis subsp. lactis]|uniref:hypothetical protein n=1 Tax=Lactococcus lactis TaxID=1358 RepID=UPI00071E6207|nr:hypothetical protein [Lactococcus lactis]MRL88619.1 hypothetical protein [Lactococcus cremoris]KAF0953206.1 hypothetical protein BUI56_09290 [Lactococcus lactis subsp. lactis]RQE18198.1 hypothetical protein D6114_09930 [Lactococcus lactis]RQE27495.1 hypothetical protein D6112_00865 [Lactococcus lactis]RQE27597.1 hypothetical protein D6119_06920 [Lactococcus lactis]
MIEHHQGYTTIKRYGRNSFRPAGKHPFKMIYNARAVKYDLIQQFESSTGIILPSGVKSNLCTQSVPFLGRELAVMKLQIKENRK